MKKLFYIFVLLSFICCAQDDNLIVNQSDNQSDRLIIRTTDEVNYVVNKLFSDIRSNKSRNSNIINKITPVCRHHGRAGDSDTLLYAVDLADNQGFVLIAAPIVVTPIIGYAEKGSYGDSQCLSNENFQYFIDNALNYVEDKAQIQKAVIDTFPITITPLFEYDTIAMMTIGKPRVNVEWNQMWPENEFCPNKVAGCGPIAFAQIMSFIKEPNELYLTYPEHDANITDLNWTELTKHKLSTDYRNPTAAQKYSHYNNCGASIETHNNLSRLVREIGHRVDADYNDNSTGSYYDDFYELAQALYPNKEIKAYDSANNLYENLLDVSTVAFVIGFDISAGHGWVADGTLNIKTSVTYYEAGKVIWSKSIGDDYYIHYNWGWNGSCNGFYLVDVFAPITDPEPGLHLSKSRLNFQYDVEYFTIKK